MPSFSRYLIRAWGGLVGLSLMAAVAATAIRWGLPRQAAGAVILALALAKARVILSRYLGLDRAPGWLSGFTWVMALWAIVASGLYLV